MLKKYLMLGAAVLLFNTGIVAAQENDEYFGSMTEEVQPPAEEEVSNENLDIQNEAQNDEIPSEEQGSEYQEQEE